MIILPSLIDAINLGVIFVELRTFQLKPMSRFQLKLTIYLLVMVNLMKCYTSQRQLKK
jgi:hypothetical protein